MRLRFWLRNNKEECEAEKSLKIAEILCFSSAKQISLLIFHFSG